MIEIKNIYKSFQYKVIFQNYSLKINDGEFIVLLGKVVVERAQFLISLVD